jgi:hypothetical protein
MFKAQKLPMGAPLPTLGVPGPDRGLKRWQWVLSMAYAWRRSMLEAYNCAWVGHMACSKASAHVQSSEGAHGSSIANSRCSWPRQRARKVAIGA